MNFLLILACATLATILFKPAIKKLPMLFYALAVLADAAFVATPILSMPGPLKSLVFILVQKCTLSLALFCVVMFLGVFSKDSKIRTYLMPIRSELSIIALILSLGHVSLYLSSYATRLATNPGNLNTTVLASLVVALVLLALLLILGITSFAFVKKHMSTRAWAKLQKASYAFFCLIFVHLMLMIAPSALAGSETNIVSLFAYTAVFASYAFLRIRRAILDKRDRNTVDQRPIATIEDPA